MSDLHEQQLADEARLHKQLLWQKTDEAKERSETYSQQLQTILNSDEQQQKRWITNSTIGLQDQKYNYVRRSALVQQVAGSVGLNAQVPEINARQTGVQQNAQAELDKDQKKALEMEKEARLMEARLRDSRSHRMQADNSVRFTYRDLKQETDLLNKKLETIDQALKAALNQKGLSEIDQLDAKIKALQDKRDAQDEFAHLIPQNSPYHRNMLTLKEETILQIRDLKKDREILQLRQDGRTREADRESKTKWKHGIYEIMRSLRWTKPDTSLSKEDAVYKNPMTHKAMINKGRATFGGTKPMYFYEEEGTGGKTWLYKEAVTCIGGKTPERAYITEGASKLQQLLCGNDNYIPVFVAKNDHGEAIGTFQEQVMTLKNPTEQIPKVDLFEWQEKPTTPITPEVTAQVLREHTLDWVLGNFDTKGENFLQKENGKLVSIDKEASFSHLGDPRAEHMSRTEKLHNNDTIYNVLFTQFVTRDVNSADPLFLNFDVVEAGVLKMEELKNEDYLGLFDGFLTQKCGPKSTTAGRRNRDREKLESQLLQRKTELREEYRRFFSSLMKERLKVIGTNEAAKAAFMKEYGKTFTMKDDNPDTLLYQFPSERPEAKVSKVKPVQEVQKDQQVQEVPKDQQMQEVPKDQLVQDV